MLTTIVLVTALAAPGAAADPAPTPGPTDIAPSAAEPATEAAAPASNLDFDLFDGTPAPAVPAALNPELEAQVTSRRALLHTHQILGISTLAAMAMTTLLGQLNYHDLYGSGGRNGYFMWPHRVSMAATTTLFATTGTYAMLAPEPYEGAVEDRGVSTATVHKTFTALSTLGMLTQIGLGFVTARKADAGNPNGLKKMAQIHELVGYGTFGCLAVAGAAWVF